MYISIKCNNVRGAMYDRYCLFRVAHFTTRNMNNFNLNMDK